MPVFTDYPTTKQTSLNDLIGGISNIQNFQQQQQLMPLQLERAQLETQKARANTPLEIEAKQLELEQSRAKTPTDVEKAKSELEFLLQSNKEKRALMEFQSNPNNWSTNGRVDLDKINAVIPKIAPLTGAAAIDTLTKLGTAQTSAIEGKQNLTQKQREMVSNVFGILGRSGVNDPEIVRNELKRLKDQNPDNKDLHRVIDAYDVPYSMTGKGEHVRQDLIRASQSMLSPEQQQSALSPKAEVQDIGGEFKEKITTPSVAGLPPAIQFGQKLSGKTLAPQTYTTETGAPGIIGGGGAGGGQGGILPPNMQNNSNQSQLGLPLGQPSGVQSNLGTSFEAKGGLQRSQDETYDAYKARTARLSGLPSFANKEMNMANRDSVPNQEYTNNKILNLLEKKNVEIGPIANAIANKTGGIGLNSDQQEVIKYLEQRIRQESARTNQDQSSQRSAYGSFGTSKPALLDIIYNDKGLLASQRLYNQGILKNLGDPNKPNLAKINKFENEFNQLNNDPKVTHLLGVIGTKSIDELSKLDRQHLTKEFKGMSNKEIQELFDKKQMLEDLVSGSK